MASIFRSPLFWGAVGVAAVGVGVGLHRRRGLLGAGRGPKSVGPPPTFVANNTAVVPAPTETRRIDGRTLKRYEMKSMSIDQRIRLLQQQVWDGVNDPRIRQLALKITADCGRDDGMCEAQRVFDVVKSKVRYTGDVGPVRNPRTGEVDGIDLYQKPWVTWEYGGGDCDDHVSLISSLLAVIGHTMHIRVTAPTKMSDFAHVYAVTMLPKDGPKKAYAVDTTLPWKAKVGSEAKYGKARDYPV
jgi:transglutaminase-like putative cysteine protease